MTGPRELTLPIVFWLLWACPAPAQSVADPHGFGTTTFGDNGYQLEPFGGFGFEATQRPLAGTVWIDRFGMLHGPEPMRPRTPLPVRRIRTKPGRSVPTRQAARPRYTLPTGSLDWPGSGGVVPISPALRYQTYGGGLGYGPYGSIDCSIMYKGMALGY